MNQAYDDWLRETQRLNRTKEAADLRYVDSRYQKGLEAAKAYSKERLHVEYAGDELEQATRLCGEARHALQKIVLSEGASTYILIIYDGSIHREMNEAPGRSAGFGLHFVASGPPACPLLPDAAAPWRASL